MLDLVSFSSVWDQCLINWGVPLMILTAKKWVGL